MCVAKRSHGEWVGWLQTHKWFYRREVNKNRGKRGGRVLGVHLSYNDLKEEWMGVRGGPFFVSPLVGNEKVPEVCGWIRVSGEVNQSFLDFPQPIFEGWSDLREC